MLQWKTGAKDQVNWSGVYLQQSIFFFFFAVWLEKNVITVCEQTNNQPFLHTGDSFSFASDDSLVPIKHTWTGSIC